MPNPVNRSSSPEALDVLSTPKKKATSGVKSSNDYLYDLEVIGFLEFDLIHTYVQSIFDQGRRRTDVKLKTMTNKIAHCPQGHWPYLAESDCLGVSMTDHGKPDEFHVWINPAYKAPVFKFYMTLAHELTHGYVGLGYGHNAHWRRWFYRVLWHLVESKLIPEPEDALKFVCISVEHAYNHVLKVDPMLTILEAFNKAQSEHSVVNSNYLIRLGNGA